MKTLLLGAVAVSCLCAQGPTDPPPLIQLTRMPGLGSGSNRFYVDAKPAIDMVSLTSITGQPETWFLELHQNYASLEDLDVRLTAARQRSADDPNRSSRTMLASFRPAWSYRPDQAIRMFPRARYFLVSIYQVRAGTESDFGELVKLRRASQDSVNLDRPDIAYEVISGEVSSTFIFLAPITSLKIFDEGVANTPVYAEGLASARSAARAKVAPDSELSREHLMFRVEPRLSYVSDGFASIDSAFWRPQQ